MRIYINQDELISPKFNILVVNIMNYIKQEYEVKNLRSLNDKS